MIDDWVELSREQNRSSETRDTKSRVDRKFIFVVIFFPFFARRRDCFSVSGTNHDDRVLIGFTHNLCLQNWTRTVKTGNFCFFILLYLIRQENKRQTNTVKHYFGSYEMYISIGLHTRCVYWRWPVLRYYYYYVYMTSIIISNNDLIRRKYRYVNRSDVDNPPWPSKDFSKYLMKLCKTRIFFFIKM